MRVFCRNLLNSASSDGADFRPQVRRVHLRLPLQRGHHQQPYHRPHEQGGAIHFRQNLTFWIFQAIKDRFGWGGLFPIMSAFGLLALAATYFYPYKPRPGPRPLQGQCEHPWLAKIGLVELNTFADGEEDEEKRVVVTNGGDHHQGYQVCCHAKH